MIKPLHKNVLIEVIKPENKSSGGILLPDGITDKPLNGVVVEVGSGF